MNSLQHLLLPSEYDPLTTEKWNGLVFETICRGVILGKVPPIQGTFAHPYQVTLSLDPADTNTEARVWRVRTQLGGVNDVAASMVYRAKDDSRGWQPPARIDPTTTPLVERTMLETEDPPYLLLTTPKVGEAPVPADQFQPVADTARPAYFRTAEMWMLNLWQAYVVLTGEPTAVVSPSLPAILLSRLPQRYRLIAGRLPVTPVAQAGGQQVVARLFLLRDPAAQDATADTILVQQLLFWNVAAVFVQPANPLDGADSGGAVSAIVGDIVADDFAAAATYQWWTM